MVTIGSAHSCGLTLEGRAYCWGDNFFGQLGDGTKTDRLRPVAVAGGLLFSSVSAGVGLYLRPHNPAEGLLLGLECRRHAG